MYWAAAGAMGPLRATKHVAREANSGQKRKGFISNVNQDIICHENTNSRFSHSMCKGALYLLNPAVLF